MLIGQGFDVHRLGEGYKLIMGGVEIPYRMGLIGHSDGDVVLHALTDALLGAAGLGDIGHHFPDTDPAFKGIDSRILLRRAYANLLEMGLTLHNADITIMAEAPRMAPHLPAMCTAIAADLQTDIKRINIKATTTEKLGFTGRGEGIAANAVVLLQEPQ